MPTERVIRGRRVLIDGQLRPAAIHVDGGRIADIGPFEDVPAEVPVTEAEPNSVVLPGLVDSHVHVNEPGRTEWEGFETATRAAAAGGVTTIVDMPLNSIPSTTTREALATKIESTAGKCHIDVGFWGGVVPGNAGELESMCEAGVRGFKCFLVPSGVDDFAHVEEADLHPAMERLASLGVPLLVHAELPGPIAAAEAEARRGSPVSYLSYLASRPAIAEDEAVAQMIRLAEKHGTRVHIVHHASATGLPLIAAARDSGVAITAESCPHYLHFAAENIPDGATAHKCAPPIREEEHREKLWQGLGEGVLDMVVTDHSPCTPELKRLESGDFFDAWGGIASLELGLSTMWTNARRRGVNLETVIHWMSERPAELAGLRGRKGAIAKGHDADIVFFDPEAERVIDAGTLHHRNPITPYHGLSCRGRVTTTFLRGQPIFTDGEIVGSAAGALLLDR